MIKLVVNDFIYNIIVFFYTLIFGVNVQVYYLKI